MKKFVLSNLMNLVKENNPNVTEIQLEEVEYGLEAIYLSITKCIIIFTLAAILGIFKEAIILSIFFNIIRFTAFGLHASKSIYCLLSSMATFIGGVYICNFLTLGFIPKVILSIICLICIFKYAPADTHKRPIIKAKKRKIYKIISVISATIYTILIILFNNDIISNYLLVSMIEAVIMIHPLVYKLFKMPYANYKNYNLGLSN